MKSKFLLGLSVFGLAVFSIQADTLRLRDGRIITGTLQSANRDEIRFQRDGGPTDRYDIGSVDTITFGNGSNNNSSPYNNQPGRNSNQGRANDQSRQRDQYGNSVGDADRSRNSSFNDRSSNGGVIPAGTVVSVRMIDSIDSDASHAGETYRASLDQPLVVNGQTVAPAGSDATVQIVRVQQGGRISGNEEVTLALASFSANGRTYDINTSNESVSSNSRGKQSAEVIGGGAALGAIIGAIAGGGKGAAIGAGAGAALGTGAQVLRGQRVKVPSETRLSFTLTRDLTL
jgi:hypothetical protein